MSHAQITSRKTSFGYQTDIAIDGVQIEDVFSFEIQRAKPPHQGWSMEVTFFNQEQPNRTVFVDSYEVEQA